MNVWIFNDTSCAALLKYESSLFRGDRPDYLVEITKGPSFEYFFGLQSPIGFPGISGVLSPNLGLKDLAVTIDENHPKIVFSPNPGVSSSILGSSLANLMRESEADGRIDVFIEFALVRDLLPWLSAAKKVGVVLDISVAPEVELVQEIELLKEREVITPDSWAGLHIFDSRDKSYKATDDELFERLGLAAIPSTSATGN